MNWPVLGSIEVKVQVTTPEGLFRLALIFTTTFCAGRRSIPEENCDWPEGGRSW